MPAGDRGHPATLPDRRTSPPHRRDARLPRSPLGKAAACALGEWEEFVRYLEDGRLEIDNNQVEYRIRPARLGMKYRLFNRSFEAGVNNALAHTLLADCRTHGLDPADNLAEVIRRLPHDATVEQAAPLTPARTVAEREEAGAKIAPVA